MVPKGEDLDFWVGTNPANHFANTNTTRIAIKYALISGLVKLEV